MDFFEGRYYSLPRKLLLVVGLWPYQSRTSKIIKFTFVFCISLSMEGVQVAKLLTSQVNMHLLAEVTSVQFLMVICLLKYIMFPLQEKKIRVLLKSIESDWNNLSNAEDRKIADQCAEEGRKYNFVITVGIYTSLTLVIILFGLQPVFDNITGKNQTIPKTLMIPAEYFVDVNKYYYLIFLHMTISIYAAVTIVIGHDSMYIASIYHICGMYRIVSHQLEHAFDTYKQDKVCLQGLNSKARVKIANAVKYHHTATELMETLVSTFEIPFSVASVLVFLNISLTLFCTATAVGKLNELVMSLLLVLSQISQALIVAYPCQKITDNSSAISLNTYSGQWYMAPYQLQTLILPILQRGIRPSRVVFVKMMAVSLEAYAGAIQLSLSYFTVLLSFS